RPAGEAFVVVVLVPEPVSAATTWPTIASTASSTAPASPVVAHPPFFSALLNAFPRFADALPRHAASTGTFLVTVLAWQRSCAIAFFPAALRLPAAHFPPSFVPPSGSAVTNDWMKVSIPV